MDNLDNEIESAKTRQDYTTLVSALRQKLTIDPNDATVLYNLVYYSQFVGDYATGIFAIEKLIELGNSNEWITTTHKIYSDYQARFEETLTNLSYGPEFDRQSYPTYRHALQTTTTFTYVIDIVGTCNLRCPSCPVGNDPQSTVAKGFMRVAEFRAILDKIRSDGASAAPRIWLFNWGEPLLHPDLAEIITMCNAAGIPCDISSNLNTEKNFRDALRAEPRELKISLSGYTQETYGKTHMNGNIALVKSNMYRIRYWLDRYKLKTLVRVDYHLYRTNEHELEQMRALTAELGFSLDVTPARYQPIEKVVALRNGTLDPDEMAFIDEYLIESPALAGDRRLIAGGQRGDCELRYNMMSINWDGTVTLCCGVSNATTLGVKFIDLPHADLQRLKYQHSFCATCYANGLAWTSL